MEKIMLRIYNTLYVVKSSSMFTDWERASYWTNINPK